MYHMCVCAYCITFYFVYHTYNQNRYNMYLLLVCNKQMYYLLLCFHFSSLCGKTIYQIKTPNMCDLNRIAPNTDWVERLYSHLA